MAQSSWRHLEESALEDILPALNKIEPVYDFKPGNTLASVMALPFYPKGRLLRVAQAGWRPEDGPLWYIDAGDGVIVNLDGSVAAIQRVNIDGPLALNAGTARDYLKFRLYFEVREHGRHILVESPADLNVTEDRDARRIETTVEPVTIEGPDQMGAFNMSACVHWNDKMFRVSWRVMENGMLEETDKARLPVSVKLSREPDFSL